MAELAEVQASIDFPSSRLDGLQRRGDVCPSPSSTFTLKIKLETWKLPLAAKSFPTCTATPPEPGGGRGGLFVSMIIDPIPSGWNLWESL